MREENFIASVIQWADDRNILDGSSFDAQYLKLIEEIGEIAAAKARGNREALIDGIGDAMVVCVIIARIQMSGSGEGDVLGALLSGFSRRMKFCNLVEFAARGWPISTYSALRSFATSEGIDVSEARQAAWTQIKDRKGKMVNGVFVKDSE